MPIIDIAAVTERIGVGYRELFAALTAHRSRRRRGDACGATDFGINRTCLPWENGRANAIGVLARNEFCYVPEGELVLIEDEGDDALRRRCGRVSEGSRKRPSHDQSPARRCRYLEIGARIATTSQPVLMCI